VLEQYAEVAAFTPPVVTNSQLCAAATYTRIVGSDNDPYCPEGAVARYGQPLGMPADVLAGAAHLDLDAGYGSWPSLLDWCLSPSNDTPIQRRTGVTPG
jgi:predicted alpha/beta hydrolase family esterase